MGAMSELVFDPSAYHRAPVLTVSTAMTLVDGLAIVHPRAAPPLARKALRKLKELRARIANELSARRKGPTPTRSPQEIDQVADRAWRAVRSFLSGYSDLAPEYAPEQGLAARLDEMLFGEGGLAFTNLRYDEQRTQMHDRLDALEADKLADALTRIVGDACVKNLRAAVKDYDVMVLALLQEVGSDETQLTPLVREVQKLVVDYARFIAATVDDDDPETVTAALQALAPIDNLRRLVSPPTASVVKDAPTPVDPPQPPSPTKPA